jgi:uncharacterized membrane protein (GlpM family)
MSWLNTLARWIVVSSQSPSEISLTIKGVLVGVIPYLMILIGLTHLNVGQDQLSALVDGACTLLQDALMLVSAVMTAYGLARKVWTTIKVHQQVTTTTPQ